MKSVKKMLCGGICILLACTGLPTVMAGAVDEVETGSEVLMAEAAAILSEMDVDEAEQLDSLAVELGYSGAMEVMQNMLLLDSPPVSPSRLVDLDGDHEISVVDAQRVTNFLRGKFVFNYNFNYLDANQNCIVENSDAQLYLDFATYCLAHPDYTYTLTTPVSPANGSGIFLDLYEYYNGSRANRVYHKVTYTSSTTTCQVRDYTLNANLSNSNDGVLGTAYTKPLENHSFYSASQLPTNFPYTDSRIVHIDGCGGTGFIVGDRTIVTAAHCLYNRNTNKYVKVKVNAYAGGHAMVLNPTSIHVPEDFINPPTATGYGVPDYYDYAFITVAEDLSHIRPSGTSTYYDLGAFSIGMPTYNFMASATVPMATAGFPYDENSPYPYPTLIKYTGDVARNHYVGYPYLRIFKIDTNYGIEHGFSGSPMFVNANLSSQQYALGIAAGSVTETTDSGEVNHYSGGPKMTPILTRLLFNNPTNTNV